MKDPQSGIIAKYFYDFVNRMERYTRSGAGITLDVGYTYDSENRLTRRDALIHQYTRTSTYSYDDDNRVTASSTANSSTSYSYDRFGRLNSRVNSHGENTVLSTTLGYRLVGTSSTGQVASLTLDGAGTYNKTLSYTYSVNGNILSVSMGGKTTSYAYDTAGQLLRENNQAAGKTWVWTYDDGGNILSRKEYAYTTGTLGAVLDTVDYTYGNSNWGDQLTAYDGQTITYDAIGNPLDDGTWEYTWEHGRQLKSMTDGTTTWTYGYDADGMRYSRSNGTSTWQYIYIGDQLAYMQGGGNYMYFQYDANGTPVSVAHNGTYYYYVTNLQGDVIALLDTSGNTVTEYTYDAWGKLLSVTGSKASGIGTVNPLRYRGYVYDTDTGLYYLQSRYYDPEIGRFINADSYSSTGQGLLGNNMLAYCCNNPINGSDPCGTCVHRWDFWNDCEECKSKSFGEKVTDVVKESVDFAVHNFLSCYLPGPTAIITALHYGRNALNQTYTEDELLPNYEPLGDNADKFHQNNQRGGRNRKYVIGEWFSSEVVFYDDGTINTTPEDEGTWNVYSGDNVLLNVSVHGYFDVLLYMIWGNSPADRTTIIDRIALALG